MTGTVWELVFWRGLVGLGLLLLGVVAVVVQKFSAQEDQIEKLRGPMASRSPQFFVLEEGIRRRSEAGSGAWSGTFIPRA